MGIDYLALQNEILADSLGVGYPGKSDQQQAELLNRTSATRKIDVLYMDAAEIIAALVPSELSVVTALQWQQFALLISPGKIKIAAPNVRTFLNALFPLPSTPQTNAALVSLRQRLGSRSEELFGEGTIVTHLDVARAFGRF